MKKYILTLLLITSIFTACKKEDKIQAIDITGKTYSADTKYRGFTTYLQLNFRTDGTVTLLAFPDLKHYKYFKI